MSHLPFRIAPVTPTAAFLGSAESMLEGVRVLAEADAVPAVALTVLAGHAAECGLKAFLAKVGIDEAQLSRAPFGHDVIRLWEEAASRGLAIATSPLPDWVTQLARVYSAPYVARYPMGVHGLVLPNSTALSVGVEQLVNQVRAAVQ
jgi:hypothetical protein